MKSRTKQTEKKVPQFLTGNPVSRSAPQMQPRHVDIRYSKTAAIRAADALILPEEIERSRNCEANLRIRRAT